MLEIGDIVQNKETEVYGTVEFSTFGFSIHFWSEYDGQLILGKTLGTSSTDILKYWDKIDQLPLGYKIHPYGGVIKED